MAVKHAYETLAIGLSSDEQMLWERGMLFGIPFLQNKALIQTLCSMQNDVALCDQMCEMMLRVCDGINKASEEAQMS